MKYVPIYLILFFVVCVWYSVQLASDSLLHIVVCDVGQGDATLISFKSTQILVDGGYSTSVFECLKNHMPLWDRTVEVVILSHPHDDHFGGIYELVKRFNVSLVLYHSHDFSNASYVSFYEYVQNVGIQMRSVSMGDVVSFPDELAISVIWPPSNSFPQELSQDVNPNDASIVFYLSYKNVLGLFTGDIGFPQEQALASHGVLTRVSFLKTAHHGSKYSSGMDFLRLVKPSHVSVSSGKNNHFGHPSPEVLERFSQIDATILRTDQQGTQEIITNGDQIWISE